jgi:hypothetical protein
MAPPKRQTHGADVHCILNNRVGAA